VERLGIPAGVHDAAKYRVSLSWQLRKKVRKGWRLETHYVVTFAEVASMFSLMMALET
jgi:hypothetical protein